MAGIEVSYVRSSSYNNFDFCQQQYFLSYVLGIPKPTPKKADQGTVVHKVMECLALLNQAYEKTGSLEIEDEALGKLSYTLDEWNLKTQLSVNEIIDINKIRGNYYVYKYPCNIPFFHSRVGVKVVNDIFNRSYNYYSSKSPVKWAPRDKLDCEQWTWIPLEYKNGMFDPRKLKIVEAEPHFNLTLERDWGSVGLKGTIDLVTSPSEDSIEIVDWKGLPLDTPIITINGWSTMGELKVGDIIFDKDGFKTKVIGKSKIKFKNCYEIIFDDKTKVVCDDEHLWTLMDGTVKQITDLKIGDKISITKPINTEEVKLPIDPYVLGIWLGDGRNRSGEVSNMDSFIFEEIERRGYTIGKDISHKTCPSRTIFGLTTKLRKLNLLRNKHIPSIYLRASIQQRLDLLRGLMDSDGNANKTRKQAVFTTCRFQLSNDVQELLVSLGQRPNQSVVHRIINNKDVLIYPLAFRPIDINPFLLPRKSEQILKQWGYGKSNYRTIKNISILEEKLHTQCIMVDSPSNTYLCTRNMIPTHNTGQRKDWGTGKIKDYDYLCSDFQLMFYYYAARQMFPQYKHFSVTIFFIRDGGPYTIHFDESTIDVVERKIKERVEQIRNTELPELCDPSHKDVKCDKFCDYYKMKGADGETNLCDFIHNEIKLIGIDEVSKKYKHEGHDVSNYKAPGGE